MIRTTALLIAATTLATAGAAQAQSRYYMRERIVGIPASTAETYTATYGQFGTCMGATQTASIASCKDSTGKDVALTLCSPQTKSQNCTPAATCESIKPDRAANGPIIGQELQTKIITSTEVDAVCTRLLAKYPTMAICQSYNTASYGTKTIVYAYGPGSTFSADTTGKAFGAYCK